MAEKKVIRQVGDKTREKIIKAARGLFAKHGFSGTSISQISEKAHINRSLIFHHFVNKEELWKVVKQSFLDSLLQNQNLEEMTKHGLRHFIERTAGYRFKLYEDTPDLVRMITWQHLEDNVSELLGGIKSTPHQWVNLVRILQEKGEINPKLDPELVAVMIAATISGALMSRPIVFNQENKKQEYLQMVIDGLCKMLQK